MKNVYIKIRVSSLEKEIIKRKSEAAGVSVSEIIRGLVLNYKITQKLTTVELQCYKTLVKYSDNFRRISNGFKNQDYKLIKEETEQTSKLIREHLNKFL